MTRRTLALSILALVILASMACANNIGSVEVTGNFFNPKPGLTTLCADTHMSGWFVEFQGETPYGLLFDAGPMMTNSLGKICIKTIWPQGVYAVEAHMLRDERSMLQQPNDSEAEEVAISVFNPFLFCGAQGGGALSLFSYDVPPSVKTTLAPRQATFAYIFKQRVPQNYGIWYFDNDNPLGPVEFVAQSFTDISYGNAVFDMTAFQVVQVYGNGMVEFDETNEIPCHYFMYANDFPGGNSFQLVLWDFAGNVLYRSAPTNIGPESTVLKGKNVIQPCL
jgi:hypothetical protein